MRRLWFAVLLVVLTGVVVSGQFPVGTPGVTRCQLFSTDSAQTTDDIKWGSGSYIVKVGTTSVTLYLEFVAYSVKGLRPQDALVSVVSKYGVQGAAYRPFMFSKDQYRVIIPLTNMMEPFHVLISFKSASSWREMSPNNCS